MKSLKIFLLFCLIGLTIDCQSNQATEIVPLNAAEQITANVASEEETIKRLFVESNFEGERKIEELMKFPKEKIVAVIRKLKETGLTPEDEGYFNERNNEIFKIECAHFLWELGTDTEENEKFIVDIAKKNDSRRFFASEFILTFIAKGKKEYWTVIFEHALEWNGAWLYIQGNLLDELENSPKIFLLYLSKEPIAIRKRIYEVVTFKTEFFEERRFKRIKANIKKLKKDKEAKNIAEEFLREVDRQ